MKIVYLIGFLFFILVIALVSVYLIQINPRFLNTKVLQKVSTADIYTQGDQLKIDFAITKSDNEKMSNFSDNLGVSKAWLEGISLKMDLWSIDKLKQFLPVGVNLSISDKQLSFNSFFLPGLNSSMPIQNYQISSGSSKLMLNARNSSDFDLVVTDPNSIAQYATSSGKLYISSQLQELFPLLEKIAKITLVVRGKNASGNILLK